jgi:CHAT domain-containing protein
MILGAIASRIGHKRLLEVSDGILQYIPFAALPAPSDAQGGNNVSSSPLIRDHEVVNLPSASVLAVLKKQTAGRAPAAKTVAVLADPVFDAKDVRIRVSQTSSPEQTADKPHRSGTEDVPLSDRLSKSLLLRSATEIGVIKGETSLPRLFFARAEAEAILQGIPTGQRLKALDFKASRATATSQELYNYRIVHFATHGLLNSEHPELSGLVLSLVDEQGKEQNGFLGLEDIYRLNLRADLVVLSACETGLGKEIQGEGLVGIARGFMYAGASSVVASLWKVDDLATAEFMKVFYQGMLKDRLRPAAALRRAQIAMSKRRTSPYFWAGFVLQGQP